MFGSEFACTPDLNLAQAKMANMIRPRFSISTLLIGIALVAIGLVAYRYWTAPIYRLPSDRFMLPVTTKFPGVTVETDLNLEKIDEFPVWNRQRPSPPLSAGAAIERGDRYRISELMTDPLLKSVNENHFWIFQSLELAPLENEKGIWVWVVKYNLRKKSIWYVEPRPLEVAIVVKMNGEVVEPRVY
jgi:hypothetical protein